jgi:ABC-type glycerol-3-phosphate transport system permease component
MMKKNVPADVVKHGTMGVIIALMLFPLYLMLIGSVKDLDQILDRFMVPTIPLHFANFARAFRYVGPYYLNTIYYAAFSAVATVLVAALGGYAFAMLRFPLRRPLFLVLFAKMFLPSIMSLVPSFLMAQRLGLLNTSLVIVLFCVGTSQPFWVWVMKTFMEQQPRELFESMRIEGAGELSIFFSLAVPLLRPMISLLSLNVVLFVWNDFIWPLVTLTDPAKRTITIGIFKLSSAAGLDYGMLIAGYALAALPLLVVFFISMKSFISGLTAGAIKL